MKRTRTTEAMLAKLEALDEAARHAEDAATTEERDITKGPFMLAEQDELLSLIEGGALWNLIADLRETSSSLVAAFARTDAAEREENLWAKLCNEAEERAVSAAAAEIKYRDMWHGAEAECVRLRSALETIDRTPYPNTMAARADALAGVLHIARVTLGAARA